MSDLDYFNEDKAYELLHHIIDQPNLPDAESIADDLKVILKLCYTYTSIPKYTANDLAEAIVLYLGGAWGAYESDFQAFAKDWMTLATDEEPPSEPSLIPTPNPEAN